MSKKATIELIFPFYFVEKGGATSFQWRSTANTWEYWPSSICTSNMPYIDTRHLACFMLRVSPSCISLFQARLEISGVLAFLTSKKSLLGTFFFCLWDVLLKTWLSSFSVVSSIEVYCIFYIAIKQFNGLKLVLSKFNLFSFLQCNIQNFASKFIATMSTDFQMKKFRRCWRKFSLLTRNLNRIPELHTNLWVLFRFVNVSNKSFFGRKVALYDYMPMIPLWKE
jgi:hypothetical protein